MKKAIIINIYGVPGAGKSTAAAYIFANLKELGYNVELVTEFVKGKVWEGNTKAIKNQAYIFGQQYYAISRVEDEVDAIITDSPLLLSALYNNDELLGQPFNEAVKKVTNSYETINYLLKRVKKYNPKGRNQTEEQSDNLSEPLKKLLNQAGVEYEEINGTLKNYDKIIEHVVSVLQERTAS